MNLTLLRDKEQEKLSEKEKLTVAVAQSNELFANLLTEKFIESIGNFVNGGGLEALVDVQIVLEALADVYEKEYKPIYEKQVNEYGKYTKRFMTIQMQTRDTKNLAATDKVEDVQE